VVGFQSFYLIDYFIHEEAVLTTWDIKHEKFGWMLCWGDLVWLPFIYTLQAQYLVNHIHELPTWGYCHHRGLKLVWLYGLSGSQHTEALFTVQSEPGRGGRSAE
jgi:hypothetical protein